MELENNVIETTEVEVAPAPQEPEVTIAVETEFEENLDTTVETDLDNTEDTVEEETQEVEVESDLAEKYSQLQTEFTALQAANESLTAEVAKLREYYNAKELENKQAMIDSFYMLSDEDKKDVVENINTYSLDEIEAKLSIICVRNKVNFNLDSESEETEIMQSLTFNLNASEGAVEDADRPEWIKAVKRHEANI